MKRKIAILGGSFNPIHNGHIMLGIKAYEQFGFEKVIYMPNKSVYYKEKSKVSDDDRYQMVKLAASQYDYLEASDYEIKKEDFSYTVDTINEMYEMNPDVENQDIYFIIGGDSLKNLYYWKKVEELFKKVHFLCAVRDEIDMGELLALVEHYKNKYEGAKISILKMEDYHASSSEIRKLFSEGNAKEASKYISKEVYDYIIKNDLY